MRNDTSDNETTSGRPYHELARSLQLNLVMLSLGILIVLVNTALLRRMQQRRSFLKAKRFAFLANLTICDLLGGLLLVFMSVSNMLRIDGPLVCILHGETCLNLCLAMMSYTCTVAMQFIAIRYPIYYKITVTKAKVMCILIICWVIASFGGTVKILYVLTLSYKLEMSSILSVYPYFDLFLKIFYLVGNGICYPYVLVIALRRKRQQEAANMVGATRDRPRNRTTFGEEEKETEDSELDDVKIRGRIRFRRKALNRIQHYGPIITSGIRLFAYGITWGPYTVYSAMALISDNSDELYWETSELGTSLVLLCFCRALTDPLVTLTREKPLEPRRKASNISGNSASVATTSFIMNSRIE